MTEAEFQQFMYDRPLNNNVRQGFFIGGVWVSVQGGYGKHSWPDTDGHSWYTEWEIGFPSQEIKELLPFKSWYSQEKRPEDSVYTQVPTEVLLEIISRLGAITERESVVKETLTTNGSCAYFDDLDGILSNKKENP
jgi:hypothetical protein